MSAIQILPQPANIKGGKKLGVARQLSAGEELSHKVICRSIPESDHARIQFR